MECKSGDVIEVRSPKVDQPPRRGTVEEVISEEPLRLRVTWEDGHSSTFSPHAGMARVIDQPAAKA